MFYPKKSLLIVNIVGIEPGNDIAGGPGEPLVDGVGRTGIRFDDHMVDLVAISLQYSVGAVCTLPVDNDVFQVDGWSALLQHALQRCFQKRGAVIVGCNYAEAHCIFPKKETDYGTGDLFRRTRCAEHQCIDY